MASAKTQTKGNGSKVEAPVGFERLIWDIDGWYSPELCEKSNTPVIGRLVQTLRLDSQRGSRIAYLIQLSAQCPAALAGGEETMLEQGDILAVSERAQLQKLREYAENHPQVWILCQGKRDIGHGQQVWRFDLRVKGNKAESAIKEEDLAPLGNSPQTEDTFDRF